MVMNDKFQIHLFVGWPASVTRATLTRACIGGATRILLGGQAKKLAKR